MHKMYKNNFKKHNSSKNIKEASDNSIKSNQKLKE